MRLDSSLIESSAASSPPCGQILVAPVRRAEAPREVVADRLNVREREQLSIARTLQALLVSALSFVDDAGVERQPALSCRVADDAAARVPAAAGRS